MSMEWERHGLDVDPYPVREQAYMASVGVEVIKAKSVENQAQIDTAYGKEDTTLIALKAVEVVLPITWFPENLYPETMIPLEVRAPTAVLVSDEHGTGAGMPWTTSPASIVLAAPALGTMLLYIGRQVAAQIAISGMDKYIEGVKTRYARRGLQFRFRTGVSEFNKGSVVRPRGEDGKVPEGQNPYEDPDGSTWYLPWTWF